METALSAFLLSTDPQSLSVAKHTFDQYAVRTTTCRTYSEAFETLKHKRFDLFVLDFDLRGVAELLSSQTLNCLSQTSSVIALTAASAPLSDSLRKRARYSLNKPLTAEALAGTLQSMYRLMFMEKRAYFRCAVRIPASAAYQQNFIRQPLENAVLQDLSQNGLCLNTGGVLPQGVKTFVDFELPGTADQIHVIGNVIWSDRGRSGIQFSSVPSNEFDKLRCWLNTRCPWTPELMGKTIPPHAVRKEQGRTQNVMPSWSRPQ
jgi:CheY-like chemotaxis protein